VRDNRDSADRFFVRDDDRDLCGDRCHTGKGIDSRRDEARDRQHSLVAVIVADKRSVRIDRSCGRRTVTREMRVHLTCMVMGCLVVVEVHVRHRSGHSAHLHGNGQNTGKPPAQHKAILDDGCWRVKEPWPIPSKI